MAHDHRIFQTSVRRTERDLNPLPLFSRGHTTTLPSAPAVSTAQTLVQMGTSDDPVEA